MLAKCEARRSRGNFPPHYGGSSLHEEFVELHTILAMLFGYTCLHTNIVSVFATTAAVLHRSDTLAVLLHHSCVVDIHDRYANRFDNNATRDREESVHSQWGDYAIRAVVLRQQVPADGDLGDPVAVHLLPVPLPRLHAAKLQVPVYISGSTGPDLERLG